MHKRMYLPTKETQRIRNQRFFHLFPPLRHSTLFWAKDIVIMDKERPHGKFLTK